MSKEDLRIRRTKRQLHEALINLLKEKEFQKIKVIDICKESNINRSTFYDHYNDKYELLSSYMNYLKKDLTTFLDIDIKYTSIKDYYLKISELLLDYLNKNKDKIKNISSINNYLIYEMIYESLLVVTNERFDYEFNDFYIGGIASLSLRHQDRIKLLNQLKTLIK